MQLTQSKKIAVIGGGASGISAAHFLIKKGHRVVMFEKDGHAGGRIASAALAGRQVAIGGKNFGRDARLFPEFVQENGNAPFEAHNVAMHRELGGKFLPMRPRGVSEAFQSARALGFRDTWKFFKYIRLIDLAKGGNDFLGNDAFIRISEESDHQPLSAYFGPRFNEGFLRLLTVRSNGAEPDGCYLGNLCANLGAGAFKGLQQLGGDGMHTTLQHFLRNPMLQWVGRTRVDSIGFQPEEGFRVSTSGASTDQPQAFDAVIVALPAQHAGFLLNPLAPGVAEQLNKINYNHTAIAVAKYSQPVFGPQVGAISLGKEHAVSSMSAYGDREHDIVRYTFSGQEALRTIDAKTDPAMLLHNAERELARYVPSALGSRTEFVYRYFQEGHCAYAPYHHRIIRSVTDKLKDLAVEVTGDYIKGSSVEACFMASRCAVDALDTKLRARAPA